MEPIAIVGMACRFPGAASLTDYWKLLSEGGNGIGEVPADRWDAKALYDIDPKAPGKTNTLKGGFIQDIDRFDAAFFGISPREAVQMDPQQRILLELAYEALEDAGIAPSTLAGSNTAVYIGVLSNDYIHHQIAQDFQRIDVHTGSGAGFGMLANRLSYQFDLHGPSMAIDSACSSSLVTVFQACQSLWTGETSLALAGGANLMLIPAVNVFYAKAGLSAPDGRCKTFSAEANGIGRSEGAGLVVLKRERDAVRDGDSIYAVIRGGALNHDGRSNGVTAPNRWAQEHLIRNALRHAGVRGDQLHYVELHGTGTCIGDTIEANALGAVLIEHGRKSPCLVGSVKSNIGHLEGAAGVAGLIKLALSLHHRYVPASLWFDSPNPSIDFDKLPLAINTKYRPWPVSSSNDTALAGISSFGLGGTNAHLVLASAPICQKQSTAHDGTDHLLVLGARSESALRAMAQQYLALLDSPTDVAAICASAMRRDLHDHRLHVYGCDQQALIAGLQDYLIGRDNKQITAGRFRPQRQVIRLGVPEVVNLSPTRLAQWFEHAERARDTWQNCREILIALGDDRLPKITHLADAPAPNDAATQALWAFTAQYAQLQQLLALLLHDSVVLVPSGLGQLASCCASGALSLTQALGWLKRDLMQPVPATAVYHVTCECSTGVNPGLETLVWTHDEQAWLQRLAANGAALQLVLNSDGRIVADNALHVMPPDGGSFLQFLSVLGLRANVSWQTLAVRSALKLPAYPWQRQSYWLPRPERNAAPASAPAVLVAVTDNSNLCRELSVMSLADQETRLRTYLRERVAAALHMPIEGVTIAQPVDTLGMDSLTAVEIKNRIERDLHITIPVVKFLNGYSVADCAAFLLAELSAKPPSNVPGHVAGASITALPTVASPTVLQPESDIERQIAAMSSAQVDAMLELLMHEST